MSYILEALKKAQAERQLGNAPTIHAPPPTYAPAPGAQGGNRRYLIIGIGAGVLAAAAALLWTRHAAEQPVQVASAPAVPAPVAAPAPAPVPVAEPAVPAPAPVPAAALATAPVPAPREVAAPPKPAPVKAREATPPPPPAVKPAAPADPAPVALAPPADESLRSLPQLPEALQREIPRVTFGGYIYSPTPGESLLLVDKTLRREGEEVAPGLVLERLTAKAAVMNYRGTRYRVAY